MLVYFGGRIIRTVRKSVGSSAVSEIQALKSSQSNVTAAVDDCGLSAYPVSRATHDILADIPHERVWPNNSLMFVKVEIDPEGKVTHLRVLRLAYPKAPTDLRSRINTQAVEILKRMHFTPTIYSGKPVAVCSDLSLTIDLQ